MCFAEGTLREIVFLGRGLEEQAEECDQFRADWLLGVLDFRMLTIRLTWLDTLIHRNMIESAQVPRQPGDGNPRLTR